MKGITVLGIAAILLLMVTLYGCQGNALPTSPDQHNVVIPHSGSIYTYYGFSKDSMGVKIQGMGDTTVAVVLASDTPYSGRSSAVKILDRGDTIYLDHVDNGDVWIYLHIPSTQFTPSQIGWILMPFGSGGQDVFINVDTVVTLPIFGEAPVSIKGTVAYVGDETVVFGRKSLFARKLTLEIDATLAVGSTSITITPLKSTLWFAPTTGYLVKEDHSTQMVSETTGLVVQGGSFRVLTNYKLN